MTVELENETAVEEPQVEQVEQPIEEPIEEPQEPKVFDESYVRKLRDENAKYRQRAAKADELAERLHAALVEASGRLQDASDLPYAPEHLDDPNALTEAIEELIKAKPHLASRKPHGFIPQGATDSTSTTSLASILRSNAGL